MIPGILRLIALSHLFALGLGAMATAIEWLPMIRPNAWPLAAGLYAMVSLATLATGFTLRDTVSQLREGIEG